jgi:hypothetical protein
MELLKKGAKVRLVTPDPSGVVLARRLPAEDNDEDVEYLIEFKDGEGTAQQRWFKIEQLEVL